MNHLNPVCLSLTTNLRCAGFTLGQFPSLIIPPVIEVVISLSFVYLYSGPDRWAQVLLATDGVLYFIWALLDVLSRIVPAAHVSLSVFRALDFLVGAVSFTPILLYSIYLYRLSSHDFIPALPRKLQPYLKVLLLTLLVIGVAINEVSSFVGTHPGTAFKRPQVVINFPQNNEAAWLSWSHSSLAIYAIIQSLFFLLAFSRLFRALLDQRRIELTHSDEQHCFNGIAWITAGIVVGVVETIAGFTRVSFGVALARRILRLTARATLMLGLLKGLDVAEDYENLADELYGVSRMSTRSFQMFCVNPRWRTFGRISQSYPEQFPPGNCLTAKKQSRDRRVTVHCENGQAPFLQIRFSVLGLPTQALLADMVQRGPLSEPILGCAGAGANMQQHEKKDVSNEMASTRNTALETRRTKSAVVTTNGNCHIPPDWTRPPERFHARRGSEGTASDSWSVVRDLERRFSNLPPRVTGKYRGSILGENYNEDQFPVVGVSRQSSLCRSEGAHNQSREGGATAPLGSSGSIKRKPAPPLLENLTCISDQRKRLASSTWGGLTQNTVSYPAESPMAPSGLWEGTTVDSPDAAPAEEPSTPMPRRAITRDVIKRVSRAFSDASIRSAEWLASASSPRSARSPITAAEVEMYRRGTFGPGPARLTSGVGAGENPLVKVGRRSTDDARARSKPSQPRTSVGI